MPMTETRSDLAIGSQWRWPLSSAVEGDQLLGFLELRLHRVQHEAPPDR